MTTTRSSEISKILFSANGILPESKVRELITAWGLPMARSMVVDGLLQALESAAEIGYPVVLKVNSPKIIHKSDSGGVQLNLNNPDDLKNAYQVIQKNCFNLDPNFKVTVEKMVPAGVEVIIGVSTDDQFGPVIMFGLGGIFVELFKDVVFRLIPLDESDAQSMIESIKAYKILTGFRGNAGVDLPSLKNLLMSISLLISENPCIKELDLNPVILYPDKSIIVDARMVTG